MATCGIYRITNILDGHVYIGSSSHVERRLANHRTMLRRGTHHSIRLQRAWVRDGEQHFRFELLIECGVDQLLIEEQRQLDFLDWSCAYNMSRQANRIDVGPCSDATREKHRRNILNRLATGWSARRGMTHSSEAKQKMKVSRCHFIERTGIRWWPCTITEETRKRMSDSAKARVDRGPRPQAVRDKISATLVSKQLDYTERAKKIKNANLAYNARVKKLKGDAFRVYWKFLNGAATKEQAIAALAPWGLASLNQVYTFISSASEGSGLPKVPAKPLFELIRLSQELVSLCSR